MVRMKTHLRDIIELVGLDEALVFFGTWLKEWLRKKQLLSVVFTFNSHGGCKTIKLFWGHEWHPFELLCLFWRVEEYVTCNDVLYTTSMSNVKCGLPFRGKVIVRKNPRHFLNLFKRSKILHARSYCQ